MTKVLIIGAGGSVRSSRTSVPRFRRSSPRSYWRAGHWKSASASQPRSSGPSRRPRVDADNVAETTALIRRIKPDLVLNAALPYQDLPLMDACLEAGVDYLDTANYEPPDEAKFEYGWQWAYQYRFRDKCIMALLGSGFDPAVTNVNTAYIRKHHLDEIHELDIIDCNAGDHGQPFATNFDPEINIREVTAEGRYCMEQFDPDPFMADLTRYGLPWRVGTLDEPLD